MRLFAALALSLERVKPPMKKILLLCLSFLPLATFAGSVQYALINDFSSIQDPINITEGYISYYFNGPTASQCPKAIVDLKTVTTVPLAIKKGTASKFTFKTSSEFDSCLGGGNFGIIELHITQVDGINKDDGSCKTYTSIQDPQQNLNANQAIIEQTNGFYCYPVNASK